MSFLGEFVILCKIETHKKHTFEIDVAFSDTCARFGKDEQIKPNT